MKRNLVRLSMVCLLAVGIFAFASPNPAQAATVRKVTASCSSATVSGKVTKPAPYIRIAVALASDLNKTIAQVYTRVRRDKSFSKTFSYSAQQPSGTNLVFAICESNGRKCLRPATMVSASCQSEGSTPTPTPVTPPTMVPTLPATSTPIASPTMVSTLPPTPTPITPPTMVPTLPPTPTPITPPTMVPTPTPVFCTAPTTVKVTCSWAQVSGCITMSAPYFRVMIATAAEPITEIGAAVAPVQPDGSYVVTVNYPLQPTGTHLIGGYGEWDGSWWLHPSTMFGADCSE